MRSHPTRVVILESQAGASEIIRRYGPVCEADHVLCRDPGEPRERFAQRVMRSVGALAEENSLARIAYVTSPGSDVASTRQNVLQQLVVLLDPGGALELLARHRIDLIEAVDPLLALAKTGVHVRAVQ